MKTIHGILERDYKTLMRELDRFYEVLKSLRYEGKMTLGRNLAQAKELVAFFRKEALVHMKEEERALFPFLRTHIPRLEPVMCLLQSEHQDLRACFEALNRSFLEAAKSGSGRARALETIREQGTYLLCLMRSHLGCESRGVYRTADNELRQDEKRTLVHLLTKV